MKHAKLSVKHTVLIILAVLVLIAIAVGVSTTVAYYIKKNRNYKQYV